jgi:hypothetical protein
MFGFSGGLVPALGKHPSALTSLYADYQEDHRRIQIAEHELSTISPCHDFASDYRNVGFEPKSCK